MDKVTTEPVEKESVGWRLPKVLMEKSRKEAKRMGLSITGFISKLMIDYFKDKD